MTPQRAFASYIDTVYSKGFIRAMVIMGIAITLVVGLPMGLVVFASAPWDTVPSTAEAVGVWQVGNTDQRMTLYPNHKLTFSNLPKGIIEDSGSNNAASSPRISGTGTWTAFSNEEGYGPQSGLSIDGTNDEGNDIDTHWFGSELVIATYGFGKHPDPELDFHRISATPWVRVRGRLAIPVLSTNRAKNVSQQTRCRRAEDDQDEHSDEQKCV